MWLLGQEGPLILEAQIHRMLKGGELVDVLTATPILKTRRSSGGAPATASERCNPRQAAHLPPVRRSRYNEGLHLEERPDAFAAGPCRNA